MKSVKFKINSTLISLFSLIVFSLFSCTDLDEIVYDKIPENEYGKTQEQINSVIAPIYRSLQPLFPSPHMQVNECSGSMAIVPTRVGGDWWDGGQFMALKLHTWTPETSLVVEAYKKSISGVTTCNSIYSLIENNPGVIAKDKVLAEIRGVRAFWYYILMDMFGNVPVVTDSKDVSLPKTTKRAEVFKFVEKELLEVKDKLDAEVNSKTYGHLTKGVAWTILAKIYLNAEVWTGTPQWQKAADACDSVMKFNYALESNWGINFVTNNEVSKEIIFPAIFREGEGGNSLHKRTLHYLTPAAWGLNIGSWNGISAVPSYVKEFDTNDKRLRGSFFIGPIKDPLTGETLITAHSRPLIHTIDIPQLPPLKEDTQWGNTEQESGARCSKWEFRVGISSDLGNDFAIFRLADVYLMKAEALVRMGKGIDEATHLVNEIRKRAFDNPSFLLETVTLDDIYKERHFELAWESYSRQDKIRFGKFLEPSFLKPSTSDKIRLLFPIPFEALRENKNLEQNDGYAKP